jgi:hypothetical protein
MVKRWVEARPEGALFILFGKIYLLEKVKIGLLQQAIVMGSDLKIK